MKKCNHLKAAFQFIKMYSQEQKAALYYDDDKQFAQKKKAK